MTVLLLWIAFSSVFSLLLGYSRIPYAAAADGNFFAAFARLHPKGNFPHVSLITLGLIASLFSLGRLNEVIGSLIATRVLIQYLPQTVGFFLLRSPRAGFAAAFQDVVLSVARNHLVMRLGLRAARRPQRVPDLCLRHLRGGNRRVHGAREDEERVAVRRAIDHGRQSD